jgi:hypothetical protein
MVIALQLKHTLLSRQFNLGLGLGKQTNATDFGQWNSQPVHIRVAACRTWPPT